MINHDTHPRQIGKYIIEEHLGGGMSRVYRARDSKIGRLVALKVLTEASSEDPEAKERFLLEARSLGSVSHGNIIKIFDFGEYEGRAFMVMEFLRGEDLKCAIQAGRTGDFSDKLRIARQLASGFEHVHTHRIIHRDIKPSNAWITDTGVAKIMDFGIAKTEGLQMTRTGMVVGSPYYMSPEQVVGKNITAQVDVYAYGALLFELFCGEMPIKADSVERIFYAILNEPLDESPLRRAGVPAGARELIVKCMSKEPRERPQGFASVRGSLEKLLGNANARSAPMRESRRSESTAILDLSAQMAGTAGAGGREFRTMTELGSIPQLGAAPAPGQADRPPAEPSAAPSTVPPRQPRLLSVWKRHRTAAISAAAAVIVLFGALGGSLRPPSLKELLSEAQQQSRSAPLKSREMYQRALRLDPGNQAAHDGLRELEQIIAIDEGR